MIGEEQYRLLFHASEKFHSTLNKDILLEEIILTLHDLYPSYSCFLLLSQDNYIQNELPVTDLEYDSENIEAIRAFVTGNVQLEESAFEKRTILYVPLKGKQAIYGVLQIIIPEILEQLNADVEFITLLARAAGSALENAEAYRQSQRVISDLQLINETSSHLNSNLRLAETISYMARQIKHSFGAQEAGFFLLADAGESPKVLPGSTSFFSSKQARIYIDYIKGKILANNQSVFIGDLSLPKIEVIPSFRSIIAIPMIKSEALKGFSIMMHRQPFFFSFDNFKLLQALIHHSSLALTNSMLREELEKLIITDHLTKLHSRKFLDEKIQLSMDKDEDGAFVLIDIDNFKEINDSHGHQIGDSVLIQVANLIKNNIRGNDIGARWGGEELAIYLPNVKMEAARSIAERLVTKISEISDPHITVSCGVSYWEKAKNDSYSHLFKRADEALYMAKVTGKNKVVTQTDNIKVS